MHMVIMPNRCLVGTPGRLLHHRPGRVERTGLDGGTVRERAGMDGERPTIASSQVHPRGNLTA